MISFSERLSASHTHTHTHTTTEFNSNKTVLINMQLVLFYP